ncbi:MAG TPA: histidine kinase [Colwellia sp.]|nr:histidine kinase [Colwellia sp.]
MLVWLSLDTWLITILSITYLAVLFIVAHWGQNQAIENWSCKPWVYSLSLGVSCSSWAFYGTVGQAATTGAWLAPIYIGSILCLVLAWPMLHKILLIVKQQNLTSIADFIAFRYDRSPKVAALVTIVALTGIIPYIALQLRAISTSFDLLTGTYQSGISTAFVVTIVLIIFSILFGTRQIAANKQNQGLVLAIAFSSVIKLFALTAVGIFATFYVFDGFSDLINQGENISSITGTNSVYLAVAQAVLGAITIFILPQQFHMMMIENHHQQELKTARWLFPLYLLFINVFILPIAIAGQLTFPGGSVDADTYVLTLPLFYQQAWLGITVYIGGLAAATSMVIVAAIVLSTMVSTEVLTPLVLKFRLFNTKQKQQMSGLLLDLRRGSIAIILLLAFIFERIIAQQNHLATIGLLSFVLLSQFAPATIGALYWRKANAKAALTGLVVGSIVWLYTLLLPALIPTSQWIETGLWQITWLKPTALFGVDFLDSTSHGVFYSLLLNVICYVVVSLISQRSVGEKLQAEYFVNKSQNQFERHLSLDDLYSLLVRFIDKPAADSLITFAKSSGKIEKNIEYTRLQLSGVLGSASTRMVMKAASTSQDMPLEDVVSIVDEANQMFRFNRELLQSGVENIEQGISVIDADMRLVAWNQRYIQLLDYPESFVCAGKPIEELLRYNIAKGIITSTGTGTGESTSKHDEGEDLITRRIEHMRMGHNHHFQRSMPNGVVLEIRGQSMPGGGFVSTFSDITAHIEAEKALKKANESLEKRVEDRTQELRYAKAEAEAANSSKTRFLAAASHDLMQPFNALSLFTSMLKKKVENDELAQLANNIDDSLNVVEALLSDLVEISRLDNNLDIIEKNHFALDELLIPLKNEFTVLAQQDDISFSYQASSTWVNSDKRMLRRILQNFLSNAIHYCRDKTGDKAGIPNKIVLGVRHKKDVVRVEVWDNGPGIAVEKQLTIFQEFERLEQNREIPGLGLGLAIAERMASLLDLKISLNSTVGKGTCFMLELPRVSHNTVNIPNNLPNEILSSTSSTTPNNVTYKASDNVPTKTASHSTKNNNTANEGFADMSVLVIDNDALMLTAISSQLIDWGCVVYTAKDQASLTEVVSNMQQPARFIIADYHLDNDTNGVDLVSHLLRKEHWQTPCVICSADPSEQVRQHTSDANFLFLRKPVKALALKRLIRQMITQ